MAKSRLEIVLSAEERAELDRQVAGYTLPHKVVQRAKMILYAPEGQGNAEIARRLRRRRMFVGRWRKRFCEERLAGTRRCHRPRGGQAVRVRLPPQRYPRLPGRPGHPPGQPRRPAEAKTGREPFDRLVADVMSVEPYASARTVFWIVDNGPSHAGQTSSDRLECA